MRGLEYGKNKHKSSAFSITSNAAFGGSVIVIAAVVAYSKARCMDFGIADSHIRYACDMDMLVFGKQVSRIELVEIIRKILGKWVGTIVAASYVSICLTFLSRALVRVSDL